jgi:ribose transport system substrate-binding protein
MKRFLIILFVFTFTIVFYGCRENDTLKNNQPTVALVLKTLNNPYFIEMQNGAKDAAQKLKINLIVQAADREVDVEKQMQIIENLIERNVSALCVTPSGSKEIIPAIVKANKANIPVIIVDTRVDAELLSESGGVTASFIGSDNIDGGRLAGKFIIEKLNGKGNIAILEGIPGHETNDARISGLYDALKNSDGIKILASQTANWERNQGYNVFQNILQAHPDVQALFACNDMMALGAVEAIAAAGRTGEIIVVGFDAIEDSRLSIKENKMDGSVAQHPHEMGKVAIENAFKLINGKNIPTEIPIKIELITKEK